jgi:phage tail sheath gpL-like
MKSRFAILFAAVAALALSVPAFAQDTTVKALEVYAFAGVPSNGTNEVDTITTGGTPTGGTFTLVVAGGRTTAPITWSATNATFVANIQAALRALPNVGSAGVTVAVGTATAGVGTFTVTWNGTNTATTDVPALTIGTNSLTGTSPTVTVSTTTAGVAATYRNAPKGALLVDINTPDLYINTGSVGAPTWTNIKSQP